MRLNLGVEGSIERRNEGDEYRELGKCNGRYVQSGYNSARDEEEPALWVRLIKNSLNTGLG